ncbi:MAG: PTS sugar transporter subunit IIA [Treponema sp.]|nr:PTS sugar transporter subunit IIA [Treponema sp.]
MTDKTLTEWSLAALIERGGIYYNVPGTSPKELIAGGIERLPSIPAIEPPRLYREILEREALMSTGMGRGIALPHPRNPMVRENPLVMLLFPDQPLDWNTHDGSKVHTVFLIVSASTEQHLNTLSKINFLCQQEKLYTLIKDRSSPEKIIAAIREAETSWAKKN